MFLFSKDKKETIVNPCTDCPKNSLINGCLEEEFIECQTKMIMKKCFSLDYGPQYLTNAFLGVIEDADDKDRKEIMRKLFVELSSYI